MALNPSTDPTFTGKIKPANNDYPLGEPRDITIPGDGTGTPWKAQGIKDNWGFFQNILDEAGITPSGLPEKVGASQYLDGLKKLLKDPFDSVAELTGSSKRALALKAGDRVGRYYYAQGDAGYAEGIIKTAAQATADGDVITGDIGTYFNVTLANGTVWVGDWNKNISAYQFGTFGAGDHSSRIAAMNLYVGAINPNPSDYQTILSLPKNTKVNIGQVALWQGNGGNWGSGNNENLGCGQDALINNTTGYSLTVFGYECGMMNTEGFNLSAFGRGAGKQNTTGINNSYFGVVSGNACTTGNGNTGGGVSSLTSNVSGDNQTAYGFKSSFTSNGSRTCAFGVTANEHGTSDDVSVFGYEAGAIGQGLGGCQFGRGAGINGTGNYNSGFGYQTQFATGLTGQGNSSLGAFSLQGVGNQSFNTGVGYEALQNCTASSNTAIGKSAGQYVTSESNVTCVGANSAVTGSNQVQLGDLSTTVYAYGAVQDRSDIRDKLDIKDLTDAHIAFFMDVEWKQYRMNYRENYKGSVDNDGSKSGVRFHIGAIAQQVEEAMKRHSVDFAGLQHHAIKGGQDVYTIGYQEFIGIQGFILQKQELRLRAIERLLSVI